MPTPRRNKRAPTEDVKRRYMFLWSTPAAPRRGPKPSLSLPLIAEAAIEIADGEGIDAVSMPRLARQLGLSTMALYRYLPGKRELVDLMVDVAIGDPPHFDRTKGDWKDGLWAWAGHAWTGFCQHPWLIEASARDRLMGPNELRWLDGAVALIEGTGLSGPERIDAVLVLVGHVRAMAHHASNQNNGAARDDWNTATAWLINQYSEQFPALRSAVDDGALRRDDQNGLEFGIRRILDGIEVLIASRTTVKR